MVQSRSSGNSSNERKKDLLCRVKYCNRLPDIPFDPKFLTYPFDSNRFVKVWFKISFSLTLQDIESLYVRVVTPSPVQYHHTSLEGDYKHELHTETDLGLDIDLISMDCDHDADTSNFNDVDEKLLEDEVSSSLDI